MKSSLKKMLSPYVLFLSVLLMVEAGLAIEMSGKWDFTFNTDDGERKVSAVLQINGEQVSGKWGQSETPVKGTYVNGKLELKFPFVSEEGGLQGDLTITGKLNDEKLNGNWEFAGYSGTFAAEHSSGSK